MDKLWFKARRVISVLLVFAMLASITPVQAFADDTVPVETPVADTAPETVEPSGSDVDEQAPTDTENSEEGTASEEETPATPTPEPDIAADEAVTETTAAPTEEPTAAPEETAAPVQAPQAIPEETPAAENAGESNDTPAADNAASPAQESDAVQLSRQTLSAAVEGMTASVEAELPADTKIVVTKMSGDDLGDDNMQALMEAVNSNDIRKIEVYDISLTDAQGNVYTLPEGKSATVTLSGISLQAAEGQTLYAAHLKENGSADMGTIDDSTVTFTVDSFSPFVVAAVGGTATAGDEAEEPAAQSDTADEAAAADAPAVLAETYASNHYYFRNDTNDTNIEGVNVTIYYSVGGNSNLQVLPNNGGRVDVSSKQPIAFYVKVEIQDGYDYDPEDLGVSFTAGKQDGTVSSINSSSIQSINGWYNFRNAVRAAKALGCIYEFHYSDYSSEHAGEGGVRAFALVLKDDVQRLTKITYHSNNPENDIAEATVVQNKTAALLGSETFTWDNYTLVGWNTRADGQGTHYDLGGQYQVGTSQVDLYAEWERDTVTVTYNANGGDWTSALVETPDKGSDYSITTQEPTRSGYKFLNWNTREDGAGTTYAGGAEISRIQSDLTLYAQWENVQNYTVNLSLVTASGTLLKSTTVSNVRWDVLNSYRNMAGYTLANTLLHTAFNSNSGVGNAVWTPDVDAEELVYQVQITIRDDSDDLVTVSYDGNGAQGSVPGSVTLVKGDSYTVEGQGNLSKTNYTFTGWKNSADNQIYNGAETIAAVNTDITLTAQWQQIVFLVQYQVDDPERGTVTRDSEEVGAGNQAEGSTAVANSGWYFVNWTDQNGTEAGTEATLEPGEVSADQVYTAHFEQQTAITVKADDLQKTYDGTAIKATNGVQLTAGALADGHTLQAVTTVTPDVINVNQTGEHTIASLKVVDGDGNDVTYLYNITKASGSLTINPKAVTVTAVDAGKTYGEADPELTATVSGTLNGDTVEYTVAREEGEDVDTYPIHVTGDEDQGNYLVSFVDGNFTIGKATLTDAQAYAEGFQVEYDGKTHTIQLTNTENVAVSYTVNGEETTADALNVSDSQEGVVVTFTSPNYETKNITVDKIITPKPVTVTAVDAGKTYGEADPELTATVSGTLNGDTVEYTVAREEGEDVDTYPIHVTGDEDQGNYLVSFVDGNFTIGKATLTDAQAYAEGFQVEYDGKSHTIQLTNTENVTVSYTVNGEETTADALNVSDSQEDVVVTFTSPNYETKNITVDKIINPKAVTVTAVDAGKTYGEADPELTATVSGTLNGDTVEYTVAREEGEDVDIYPIHVTGDEDQGNYLVSFVDGNFTVTARAVTITAHDAYKIAGAEDPDFKAAFGATVDNAVAGETLEFTIVRTNKDVEDVDQYPGVLSVVVDEDSAVNSNYAITTVSGDFTIFADDKGQTDPADPSGETGDGIPDVFQTIFQYVSAGNGTVSGQVYEVYTTDNWQDNWQTAEKPVKQPKAQIAVSPADGYSFTNFTTDQGQTCSSVQDIRDLDATNQDTVFTAHFTIRTDLSYTVRYLEDGTGYEVAGSKTVGGQTFGTTVTETAPDIAGYTVTSDKNPQSLTIGTGENVITFYYKAVGEAAAVTPTPTETPAPTLPATTTTTPTTPTAPAGPAVTAAPEAEAEEPAEEQLPDEETPLAPEAGEEESIAEEATPLAGNTGAWALLNLILAVLTALGSVVLLVGYLGKKRKEDEEGKEEYTVKKHGFWRVASLIPGIGAIVAFLLTEDMSQPMAFVDRWTLLMVILAVIQIVIAVLSMKDKQEPDEQDEAQA